jgi:hypothetical protein
MLEADTALGYLAASGELEVSPEVVAAQTTVDPGHARGQVVILV